MKKIKYILLGDGTWLYIMLYPFISLFIIFGIVTPHQWTAWFATGILLFFWGMNWFYYNDNEKYL